MLLLLKLGEAAELDLFVFDGVADVWVSLLFKELGAFEEVIELGFLLPDFGLDG